MRFLRILILFGSIGLILARVSVNDFLDEKLKETKIEIAKLYFREEPPVQRKVYNVKWDRVWQQDLQKERPFITNVFDRVFLVEGNRVTLFSFEVFPNQTSSQEIPLTRNDISIKFIRSIMWKSVLYLLVCHESGSCSLYTGTDKLQLRHRQSIQHKGYPMDARFFVHANRLYLVVADNFGQFTVPSLIYLWRGTYMDVVADVMTTAAVSVTTFKHKQSTIIVFAQNDKSVPAIGSMLYEFKETSPERIQFLSTSDPISVHHYNHASFNFIFLMNEHGPSNLFWWDGHELLNWQLISEIKASSLIQIVSIDDDTFFIVAHDNTVQLFKFENASDCNLLSSMKLPNKETVIDVQARIDKSTMTMILVIVNEDKVYSVQSWELRMEELRSEYSIKESDILSKHLAELVEILRQRKPLVEKAESLWPFLLPADEDLTITEPLILSNLILESGTVKNIDVFGAEDTIAPRELQQNLDNLIHEIDDTLTKSKDLLTWNNVNTLTADITVDGNAFIETLQIDKTDVNFLNNVDMHSKDTVNLNETRESPTSLHGRNIVVNELKVDSICGIPFQNWALNDDASKMEINLASDKIEFSNDTIFLHSNVSLKNLNVKTLNGMDVDKFLSELFIIHKNQRIKGNVTFNDLLKVQNLTMQTLNGKPFENYLTTKTDQNFDSFVIKTLKVDNLYADTINGVPVSEAARISTENVIKGEVKIAKLHVTEKLTADSNFKLPETQSHQIYYNVTIHGDLKIGTIDLNKDSRIVLNNEELNLSNISNTFWTKSTDQIIQNSIAFENNVTIDHLQTKYLNGFTEEEYLYTNVTTIPESFKNLHFENVHIDDMFFAEGRNDSFLEIAPESLIVTEKLHLRHLRASQLFTNTFNGLPTTDILSGKQSYVFPENINFSTVRAKQLNVDELEFLFFNDTDSTTLFENARNARKDQSAEFIKTPRFHVENLNVEKINDIDMKKLIWLRNMKITDLKNLVINGDLTVTGDLKIDRIGDQPAMTYLREKTKENIVFDTKLTIDELIVQNATLKLLHGRNVNDIFEGVLSRSKEQIVPGHFSFYTITTNNVETRFINDEDTSKLTWIDEPLFLPGNVTFDDLFVDGDVVTNVLNGEDVNELYDNLLNVPVTRIADLKVDGNISWNVSSTNASSLSSLFKNAMTKTTNQTILGDVTFENDVSVSTITGEWKGIDYIRDIVADTVIDDEEIIEVTGRKIFKNNLVVDNLLVTDDVNISMINNVNIIEFNNSVVRKDRNETITGPIIFHDEVAINEMIVDDSVHNVPLKGLVLATDTLPKVTFKDLVVLQDVYLKNLDGVDFDKFVKNRVTIDGDHEILGDVQFNGVVEVTENATVSRINGIDPSDLVLNEVAETQLITGSKVFEQDVIVDGNVYARFINEKDISAEYSNSVQTDEDVEIIGDLIFESKIKVPENVSVSMLVNEINLHSILDDLERETGETLRTFTQNETIMVENITQSSMISRTLNKIFSYLEEEETLKIQAPNIKRIDVVYYEQITKLNMFGEEAGHACGLPENCSCPIEYVAELTEEGCRIRRTNGTTIVRNYHELHSVFGVNVITNAVSNSRECTSNRGENEFTTISWMKSGLIDTGDVFANVRETSPPIHGFIKDAEVFIAYGNVFAVLAIYYDTLLATHRTDSLIYKIDLETNFLSLHQKLPTDGAWDIEIFKTNHRDVYLLLGCFGDSEKSFLYKLDAATNEFTVLRTFGGKTRNTKSLFQENDRFILLDDFDTNAVHIFRYDMKFDNFYDYQSFFYDSRVSGIECFYANEFGQSDSFVIVTTENDQFYIYEYMYAQKFQVKVHHRMDDLQTMVPFYYLGNHYIFTGTSTNSTVLRIVKQGPR